MPSIEEISDDDEPLALEDNADDNAANDVDDSGLLSPPSGWPDCFSKPKLKSYIASELKGRRVRLSEAPEAEHMRMSSGVALSRSDALHNAIKLRDRNGWDVLGGFVLYENAADGSYASRPHYWNANARGLWIDLTPRRAGHASMVLVDSASTPVPTPSAEQQVVIDRLRARELADAEKREAERKAAKAAEKAAKREAKDRDKAAAQAAKEALAAQKQKEMDDINALQTEQMER